MTTDRVQGTDGIRGPVCFAEDCCSSDPISALLSEGVLTEEFFELYTFAYCQELLESGFACELDLAVIGWDPRDFSGRFNEAAVRGIRKAGLTAVVVEILPTPAISLYQLHVGAACAFVLTASHNPADQNGIKIFLGHSNLKLFPEDDKRLTERCLHLNYEDLRSAPLTAKLRNEHVAARKVFLDFMSDPDNHWLTDDALAGTTIIVDAANGAFSPLIKDLLNYDACDIVFTNCDPSGGVNVRSGVADLEGVAYISADDIENGLFSGYETLQQILTRGREQIEKLRNNSDLVLGFVFDGDGDRCFLLSYDPYEDRVLVLDGDVLAFMQAKFLQQNHKWKHAPLFVNTVESDLEVGRAAQQAGFETMQFTVGDKWILWQACFNDWQSKQEYYLQKIDVPEFNILLKKASESLHLMVKSSKYDALSSTRIFLTVEKWVRENEGNELVKSAFAHTCRQSNNIFAVGSEMSGHLITLAKTRYGNVNRSVFCGNGLKCAVNSLAAIQILRPTNNTPDFFEWLGNPFPSGFQRSLPVYYVDKSLLCEGSKLRDELEKLLLLNANWPGVEVKIEKRREEPEMLLLRVLEKGLPAAAVFVRNSGTEDKLLLYLRGRMEFAERLNEFADNVYRFLLLSFKNKNSAMAQAEQSILLCLSDEAKRTKKLRGKEFDTIPFERLLHEMHSCQKLIQKEGDMWSITETGRACLIYSERSE